MGSALLGASVAWLAPATAVAEPAAGARVYALRGDGTWLDASTDHLALSREIPQALAADATSFGDGEAVRLVFAGLGTAPGSIQISTRRADDSPLDTLRGPALSPWPCPAGSPAGRCWATLPLRLATDRLDREYAAASERSLEAELGGQLRIETAGRLLARFRVGSPRSPVFGALERLSARLRVRVLRVAAGGAPAVGGDNASALAIAHAEIAAAGKLWAQCGIDLDAPGHVQIEVVDPPPVELVAVGCEAGLPASGGQIAFAVAGHRVRVPSRRGESPLVVARRLARALSALHLHVQVSPNPRASAGASGSVDLLVRSARGGPVTIGAEPTLPITTDATLSVCLGEVDLGNGLSHFVESDAAAGTLEERALVKAFDDGDPTTIKVFIVPSFDQSGRIGESFIDDDGAGLQNTVIIDRDAVRAGPRSYALAHELGHIFLGMPGHPDDYGVDQSSSLMDADAADASVFGPRRLSLSDCERAIRESGPRAKVPLLESWPLSSASPPTSGR